MDNNLTKEEYLKLINEILNQDKDLDDDIDIPKESWIPSEPEIKILIKDLNGSIDFTNSKKSEIKKLLKNQEIIRIGKFMVKLSTTDKDNCVDIKIYEKRTVTPTGMPCNMDYTLNVKKDDRFQNCDWKSYFQPFSTEGIDIPREKLPDIIKYIQAVFKLPAFI